MRPFARVRIEDGSSDGPSWAEIGHGDVIGRIWSAALQLDDPRISEAHALVSLRGESLQLIALRGPLVVNGKPERQVALDAGTTVKLARDITCIVEEVNLPSAVVAIEGEGIPRQSLSGVCSLVMEEGRFELVPRFRPEALALFWSAGAQQWQMKLGSARAIHVAPGDTFETNGTSFRIVAIPLSGLDGKATEVRGPSAERLKIDARFNTVHIHRERHAPVVVSGIGARILSELVCAGVPMPWDAVATEIWGTEEDRQALRRRWDVSLMRLRNKLRQAGIRQDLLNSDRTGNAELVLYDGDTVVDNT